MNRYNIVAATAATVCLGLLAAACGSDDDDTATTAAPADEPSADETTADAVCPTNVVIQTDWWPEIEHGGTYQLVGPDGETDAGNFNYSGPIADAYKVGGIETVEIRAGGDAISSTPVSSVMATDDSIMLGYINLGDVIADSVKAPTVAIAKTLDLDPQMVMWDPAQNPVENPEDIAASGAQILHFDGVAYIEYMIAAGYMTAGQSNPSYGGAATEWVASGGNFFQQGFATNEVYKYENEIEWKDGAPAPVDFFTVGDLGYDNYPATMSVRSDRLTEFAPCLELLVPELAQAWIDFLADPTPIADKLIDINVSYDTFWKLSPELNARGLELIEELGIAANSPDGTYCSLDPDRVQGLYEILQPIYDNQGAEIADDPAVTFDNRFCEGAPSR